MHDAPLNRARARCRYRCRVPAVGNDNENGLGPRHRYTNHVTDHDPEIEYLRAVEELFTTLRGAPHILSPKDMQLARQWWKDSIPLTAVSTGIGEVLDRRRSAGEQDPVVSLSYCRHAVARSARRLAERRVGASPSSAEEGGIGVEDLIAGLAAALAEAADTCRAEYPEAAEVIDTIAGQVKNSATLEPADLDELLFSLETALLEGCRKALPASDRTRIESSAAQASASSGAQGPAAARAVKAFRDQAVRRHLALPRLEIS